MLHFETHLGRLTEMRERNLKHSSHLSAGLVNVTTAKHALIVPREFISSATTKFPEEICAGKLP